MPAFTATLSRVLHAIATDGALYANSFVDQQRIEIAARVLRAPRNFKLSYDPQPHAAYQTVLAAQQSHFAATLLSRPFSAAPRQLSHSNSSILSYSLVTSSISKITWSTA